MTIVQKSVNYVEILAIYATVQLKTTVLIYS